MNINIHHPAEKHLQLDFQPHEYQQIIKQYTKGRVFVAPDDDDGYWSRISDYLVARCPFCGARYLEKLDLHGLYGWHTHPDSDRNVYSAFQKIGCSHFVAVQTFINLQGNTPTELSYYVNRLDVPFVMPTFVPDHPSSKVVLHSLPICRIENGRFVPRYAVFTATYYSLEPRIISLNRRAENRQRGEGDGEFRGTALYAHWEADEHPAAYDLPFWALEGKLLWLDPSDNDLSLTGQGDSHLPYHSIQGFREPVALRKGKVVPIY